MPTRTTEAAAEYLSISVAALKKWRWEGSGPPYVKFERVVRYQQSDLDCWLSQNKVVPPGALPPDDEDE